MDHKSIERESIPLLKYSTRNNGLLARERQRTRFEETGIASHADMRPAQIRQDGVLDEECQTLIKTAMRQLHLTARAITGC